jgi:hypothetical protein
VSPIDPNIWVSLLGTSLHPTAESLLRASNPPKNELDESKNEHLYEID